MSPVMITLKTSRLDSQERMRPMQRTSFGTNGKQKDRKALIMFDAGSDYSFIKNSFARDQGYPEEELMNPLPVDTFSGHRLIKQKFAIPLESANDSRQQLKIIYGVPHIIWNEQAQIPTSHEVVELFQQNGYKGDIPNLQHGGSIDVLIGLDLAEYLPREITRCGSMILYESVWENYKMLAGQVPTREDLHHFVLQNETYCRPLSPIEEDHADSPIPEGFYDTDYCRDLAQSDTDDISEGDKIQMIKQQIVENLDNPNLNLKDKIVEALNDSKSTGPFEFLNPMNIIKQKIINSLNDSSFNLRDTIINALDDPNSTCTFQVQDSNSWTITDPTNNRFFNGGFGTFNTPNKPNSPEQKDHSTAQE